MLKRVDSDDVRTPRRAFRRAELIPWGIVRLSPIAGLSPGNARGVLDRLAGNISAVDRTSLASLKIAKGESRPPPVRCPVPLVDQPAEDRRDLAVEHVTFGLRHLVGHPHQTRARQGE